MGKVWTFLSYLHPIAGPCVMLLYPLYASVDAIESPTKADDEQWLAYWIIYSFVTLFEIVAEPLLSWIPIWYTIKLVFMTWMVLPQFRGSAFIYNKLVRENLRHFGGQKKEKKNTFSAKLSTSPSKVRTKFLRLVCQKKVISSARPFMTFLHNIEPRCSSKPHSLLAQFSFRKCDITN